MLSLDRVEAAAPTPEGRVDQGRLSLDDDIRTHMPALPDFGPTITIRHLIHHTSGLRDQWNLLALAGWRLDDVITRDLFRKRGDGPVRR